MSKVTRKNCITCEKKYTELWLCNDPYVPYDSEMILDIFCKIEHEYPKRGKDCPQWEQESEETKKNYLECKKRCKKHNEREEWEQMMDFYEPDDMPGFRG